VFEVATQFNAIFRADANQNESFLSLLGMWMARRVQSFLNLLTTHLASTDDSAQVRDALEASVFFASSMGRLGADFTAQLAPIFETRMHAIVTKPWQDGATQLKETLTICSNAGVAAPLVSHATVEAAPDVQVGAIPLEEPQPPPRQLMELPPLARFVNSILVGVSGLVPTTLPCIASAIC
jgi:conserved oligomeric Golgi complex subunit 8